jgi:hypothetical protein
MSTDSGPDLSGRAISGRKVIAVVHADMVGYSRLSRVRVGAQLIDAETRPRRYLPEQHEQLLDGLRKAGWQG